MLLLTGIDYLSMYLGKCTNEIAFVINSKRKHTLQCG